MVTMGETQWGAFRWGICVFLVHLAIKAAPDSQLRYDLDRTIARWFFEHVKHTPRDDEKT